MKQIIAIILIIFVIISLIVVAFTYTQTQQETQNLKVNLEQRSQLLAESLKETVQPNFITKSDRELQRLVDKFENRERLAGMAIYDNKGNTIATSSSLISEVAKIKKVAEDAMDTNSATGNYVEINDEKIYLMAIPLHEGESIVGALLIAQNAGFIDTRIVEIWKNNMIRLFTQASLISIALMLLVRWFIYIPIKNLKEVLRLARTGDSEKNLQKLSSSFFFKPLVKEVASVRKSLIEARTQAYEEARLRMEKLDSPWTANRLKAYYKDILDKRIIVIVSNREPYIHVKNGSEIDYYTPASGMVTAIEPLIKSCGGLWIAHGSGNADKSVVDQNDHIKAPPDDPRYTLRRVWLTDEEEKGYYLGFSNEGLWPLCHIAHVRPIFRKEDWEKYQEVNEKFAQITLQEIKDEEKPIIFIQDFQLALLPKIIKQERPDATIGIFWHTPWPNEEAFSICPWKKELLDGILGADLIGFHTQLYCNNFIDTVGKELEALIDLEHFRVKRNNLTSYIKPFPVSIAFPNGPVIKEISIKQVLDRLNVKTKYIGLGVDRLDYTKGLVEKIKGIEIFLKKYPQYLGNITFIQIAPPSKSKIEQYKQLVLKVEEAVEKVNSTFKQNGWKPIVLLKKHHTQEEINAYYKIADFCLITSLHDGMNLVAKEFIAARNDQKGVLILSQFTGASRELRDALIINPYDGQETADAIKTAIEMPDAEQTKRMVSLRDTVKGYNIFRWSAEILKSLASIG